MHRTILIVVLALALAPIMAAQGAGGTDAPASSQPAKVTVDPEVLDFGLLANPEAVTKRVRVGGVASGEYVRATPVTWGEKIGVNVPRVREPDGTLPIDVVIDPAQFQPKDSYDDIVAIYVRNEKAAEFKVRFGVAQSASSDALRKLVVYARRGDTFTQELLSLQQSLAQDQAKFSPRMQYNIVVRVLDESGAMGEYEQAVKKANTRATVAEMGLWPAMFTGDAFITAGQNQVNFALQRALHGQVFNRATGGPMLPEVHVHLRDDSEANRSKVMEVVQKLGDAAKNIVWIPLNYASIDQTKIPKEAEFVALPYAVAQDGTVKELAPVVGPLSALADGLMKAISGPAPAGNQGNPPAGNTGETQRSGQYTNEITGINGSKVGGSGTNTPATEQGAGGANGVASSVATAKPETNTAVIVAILIGLAALGLGVFVMMSLKKQQEVLNEVSQRLTKLTLLAAFMLGAGALFAQEATITSSASYKVTSMNMLAGSSWNAAAGQPNGQGNRAHYIGIQPASNYRASVNIAETSGVMSFDAGTGAVGDETVAQKSTNYTNAIGSNYTYPGWGTSQNVWIGTNANGDDHFNWSGGRPGNASSAADPDDRLRPRHLVVGTTSNKPIIRAIGPADQTVDRVTIKSGGQLTLASGAVLRVEDYDAATGYGIITVENGGTLELKGRTLTDSNGSGTAGVDELIDAANIVAGAYAGNVPSKQWALRVTSGGTLKASGFNMSGGRIETGTAAAPSNGANITLETGRFNNVPAFSTTGTPDTDSPENCFIDLRYARDGVFNLYRLGFNKGSPSLNYAQIANISASAGSPEVLVHRYVGDIAGETYDEDPLNRVRWVNNDARIDLSGGGKNALLLPSDTTLGGNADTRYGFDGYLVRWDDDADKVPTGTYQPMSDAGDMPTSYISDIEIGATDTTTTGAPSAFQPWYQRDPASIGSRSSAVLRSNAAGGTCSYIFTLGGPSVPSVIDVSVYCVGETTTQRQQVFCDLEGSTADFPGDSDISKGKLYRFRVVGCESGDTITVAADASVDFATINAIYFDTPGLYTLDDALAGLPQAGKTLSIAANYTQNGITMKAGTVRKGRLNLGSFGGTVVLDGFGLSTGANPGPVINCQGATGTLELRNCMVIDDYSNAGVPYKTVGLYNFNLPPEMQITNSTPLPSRGPLTNTLTGASAPNPVRLKAEGVETAMFCNNGVTGDYLKTQAGPAPIGFDDGDAANGWTLECFIKPASSAPGGARVIAGMWSPGADSLAGSSFCLYQLNLTLVAVMVGESPPGTPVAQTAATGAVLTAGKWHHVLVRYTRNGGSSNIKICVDASSCATTSDASLNLYHQAAGDPPFTIGGTGATAINATSLDPATSGEFSGYIDEVLFVARTMTDAERDERAIRRQLIKTAGTFVLMNYCTIDGEVQDTANIRSGSGAGDIDLHKNNLIVGTSGAASGVNNNGKVEAVVLQGGNRGRLWEIFANYHFRDLRLAHAALSSYSVQVASVNPFPAYTFPNPSLDYDGETRSGTHATNQIGADYYKLGGSQNTSYSNLLEANNNLTGGLATNNDALIVDTVPLVSSATRAYYVGSCDGATGYISAIDSRSMAVKDAVSFPAKRVGFVTWVQIPNTTPVELWLFASVDSDGDGRYDAVYKCKDRYTLATNLHELDYDASAGLVNNSVGGLRDADGNLIFSIGDTGWDGQLFVETTIVSGLTDEWRVFLTKRTTGSDGEMHVFLIDKTDGNWKDFTLTTLAAWKSFSTAGGVDPDYHAISGGIAALNPNPFAQPHTRGQDAIRLHRFIDTGDLAGARSPVIEFDFVSGMFQNSDPDFYDAAGFELGDGFTTDPVFTFNNAGRVAVSCTGRAIFAQISPGLSTLDGYINLSDAAAGANPYRYSDEGADHDGYAQSQINLANFSGVEGVYSGNAQGANVMFWPLFNDDLNWGRGAIVATSYQGGAAFKLLDKNFDGVPNAIANIEMHQTGDGGFKEGVAPVIGRPTNVRLETGTRVCAVATDAGLVYCWRYATSTASTADKGVLLPGFPVAVPGGRVTSLQTAILSTVTGDASGETTAAALRSKLNATTTDRIIIVFTDSGQILAMKSPKLP